jgi:ADP-heptose:LPS heptosyltransferase
MAVGFCLPETIKQEYFDRFNTNIRQHCEMALFADWHNGSLASGTFCDWMISMARRLFCIPANVSMRPEGILAEYLSGAQSPHTPKSDYIAVNLYGTSWPRHYSSRNAAAVLRHFAEWGFDVVLLGNGAAEARKNAMIADALNQPAHVFDYSNKLPIDETFRVIAGAALFWGVDSSLAHAAHNLGRRAVVLKPGAQWTSRYVYEDENMLYLTADIPCVGCKSCNWRQQEKIRRHGDCIRRVAPADVIRAMETLLQGEGGATL